MGTGLTILVPQPGFESRPSAMRVWSPNHWTTREFPCHFFFFKFIFGCTRSLLLHGGFFAGCGVRAFHCRGFCCGSWALGCVDSVVTFLGFRAKAQ